MKEQLVAAIAVEVCDPEPRQRAGCEVAAAPFVALRIEDRNAPPPGAAPKLMHTSLRPVPSKLPR